MQHEYILCLNTLLKKIDVGRHISGETINWKNVQELRRKTGIPEEILEMLIKKAMIILSENK